MHYFAIFMSWAVSSLLYPVVVSQFPDLPDVSDVCSNNTVNIAPSCWDGLGVPQFLELWWNENEESCNTIPYQNSGFASCFQQKLQFNSNPDCNNITDFGCPAPSHSDNITLQEFYVLQSIYNIHAWYTSMWQSAVAGDLFGDQLVTEIIDAINPVLPGDTSLGVLLSALSAGFAFLAIPAGSAGGIGAKVVSTAIGQAPGLVKTLLPTGSLDSELKQIGEIQAFLGNVTQQFQANLVSTLNVSQSNFTNFMDLSSDGAFIGGVPSLDSFTTDVTRIFKTFVVSQALQANNIIVTVARNMSVHDLYYRNASEWGNETVYSGNKWRVNCQDPPNEYGVCDNWWIDPKTNDSYALFNLGNMEENYFDLMNTMFSQGWTTGEDLFLGSDSCNSHSFPNVSGAGISALLPYPSLATDNLAATCFSSLRVCTWNQTNNPAVKDGYEFETNFGCAFAWPNVCVNDEGFHVNSTLNASEAAVKYTDPDYVGSRLYVDAGAGSAFIFQNGDEYSTYDYEYDVWQGSYGIGADGIDGKDSGAELELLGYNTLYDILNNRIGALQQQASDADKKQCQQLPQNSDRPGWGGAGYHTKDKDCDKVPASYLGPGLYFDAAFCGPGEN